MDKYLRALCWASFALSLFYAGFSAFQLVVDSTSLSSAGMLDNYLVDAFISESDIALSDVVPGGVPSASPSVKEELLAASIRRNIIFDAIGFIVSLLAALSIFFLLKEADSADSKQSFIDVVTTEDEKLVISSLTKSGGVLTQSELVSSTGLTKVKVHRVIKRLEGLGILSKYPYGMTNKVRLEKRLDKK